MGLLGLLVASYGGLEGILSRLTTSDHPRWLQGIEIVAYVERQGAVLERLGTTGLAVSEFSESVP